MARIPKVVLGGFGIAHDAALLSQFGEDHIPTAHAHDDQNQQRRFGHHIALCP
jgi:hypothetical protein